MLRITEYWNKVICDKSAPFGTRVLPEYEIKRELTIEGNLSELKKRWRGHPRMTINHDSIIEDFGRSYGIHSYNIIKEV